MRTVDDLRRAMIEETADLAPRVTAAQVRQRARRRGVRWGISLLVAAVAPLTAGLLVATLQPSAPPVPSPTLPARPAPTVPVNVDPSFPSVGDVITTGMRVGDDSELVLWFHRGPALAAGLRDTATGNVRSLEEGPGGENGFSNLAEIDDKRGGSIDYGLFVGDAARITVTTNGTQRQAELAPWSGNRSYIVFWTRHDGSPLTGATQLPLSVDPTQPQFTAYDAAGTEIARSDGSRRTDTGINAEDKEQVGELIRTGKPTASGRELVLWFVGDNNGVLLKAGEWDPATRKPVEPQVLGPYHRPVVPVGFYNGYHAVDGPAGTKIMLGSYTGTAATVTMAHPAEGVVSGSARWSTEPTLVICWAANVPAATAYQISAVAYDAGGRVLAATDFRN